MNANFIIHDTVGFSDRVEESPQEIVETLRKFFCHSQSKFTHIFFVLPYHRISAATNKSWALLCALFEDEICDKVHVILTHCDTSRLNAKSFVEENQHLVRSNVIVRLIDHIYHHHPNHLICCSLLADSDSEEDVINLKRRKKFLAEITKELEVNQLFEPKQQPFPAFLAAFFRILRLAFGIVFNTAVATVTGFYDSMKALWDAGNTHDIQMEFHYCECPVCASSDYNEATSFACVPDKCDHIFLVKCLRAWCEKRNECPMCATKININDIRVLPWTDSKYRK